MPGMSGLELQEQLIARKSSMPVVFITGHGDVPMAVSTMKRRGRLPRKALQRNRLAGNRHAHVRAGQPASFAGTGPAQPQEAMLARLTAREQQVLERIVAGRLNKQIADDLGISIKTVEAHRANIMEKLQVTTVADLMKVALAKSEGVA